MVMGLPEDLDLRGNQLNNCISAVNWSFLTMTAFVPLALNKLPIGKWVGFNVVRSLLHEPRSSHEWLTIYRYAGAVSVNRGCSTSVSDTLTDHCVCRCCSRIWRPFNLPNSPGSLRCIYTPCFDAHIQPVLQKRRAGTAFRLLVLGFRGGHNDGRTRVLWLSKCPHRCHGIMAYVTQFSLRCS